MTKKIIFAGCSYTAGNGWAQLSPDESMTTEVKDSPHLWVNLVHNNIEVFKELELINIGKGGVSNTDIFTNTMRAMSEHGNSIDTFVCQWTSMPRYNWNVGFELWDTSENIPNPGVKPRKHHVNLNRGDHWPREYVDDLVNRLRVMHHLHWEILKVVDYSNIIQKLVANIGINRVYFVNGLCPWDKDYFVRLQNVLPENFTEFTKTEILNIKTRDDEDIHALYNLAHDHYQEKGGIDTTTWINLYQSFYSITTDYNYDRLHPGIESNLMFCKIFQERLQQ
jgi:hypothetical protein